MDNRIERIERTIEQLILSLQDSIKEIDGIKKELSELQNGCVEMEEGIQKELNQVYDAQIKGE